MDIFPFFKGIIIGLSIAAPIGPIGILCIRRTLTNGRISGLISGLGAATADGFYGVIAAFGVSFAASVLTGQQMWFRLIGGTFLLYLGIKILLSKPLNISNTKSKTNLPGDYFSTFLLTILNPYTILSFAAIFAGLGLENSNGKLTPTIMLVFGIVTGSVLWSFALTGTVAILRSKFNLRLLKIVNRISGMIIIFFALIAFVSIVKS